MAHFLPNLPRHQTTVSVSFNMVNGGFNVQVILNSADGKFVFTFKTCGETMLAKRESKSLET